jgi:hypothetical protein
MTETMHIVMSTQLWVGRVSVVVANYVVVVK